MQMVTRRRISPKTVKEQSRSAAPHTLTLFQFETMMRLANDLNALYVSPEGQKGTRRQLEQLQQMDLLDDFTPQTEQRGQKVAKGSIVYGLSFRGYMLFCQESQPTDKVQ
jgi:hypothetical protein